MEDEKKSIIQFYLQSISSQDSLLQSYRALFLGIEAVLFGLAYVLYQSRNEALIWLPAMIGIIFSFLWIFVCSHRGCMIDQLKKELKKLTNGQTGDLKRWFELSYGKASSEECLRIKKLGNLIGTYKGPSEKWIPRVCFNLFFPIFAISLWIWILNYFN